MIARLRNLVARLAGLRFLPRAWQLPSFVVLGAFVGLGAFVLYVSRAPSYLSDSPETCINCHVMNTQYISWQHSSHVEAATCNDCHVPHDNVVRHYGFKAKDGLWHATVFTMRWEPQVIRLSEGAIPVVESNCRRCHEQVIDGVSLAVHQAGDFRCWDCHRQVPHGRARSLSAAPTVFQPRLPDVSQRDRQPAISGRRPRPADQ